jgi:hypothetical protein
MTGFAIREFLTFFLYFAVGVGVGMILEYHFPTRRDS